MIGASRQIRFIPAFLICAINFLFAYKYSARYTEHALAWSSLYALLLLCSLLLYDNMPNRFFHRSVRYGYLVAVAIAGLALLHFIPVEKLRVDRWDIIRRFLDALFRGEYPYAIRSMHNNPPGPLPSIFCSAFPSTW